MCEKIQQNNKTQKNKTEETEHTKTFFSSIAWKLQEDRAKKNNKMKPTNPNAHTYVEDQRQYIF